MRLTPAIHLLFLLLTVAVRASSIGRASVNSTACDRAKQGVEALQKNYYDPHLGLWGCGAWMSSAPSSRALAGPAPGWWNCACSFEAIVDYMDAAGDASYAAVIENSYRATLPIFSLKCDQEDSMDDIAWWGTAWARAGEVLGDSQMRFTNHSVCYFVRDSEFWDGTCGGGVWWSSEKTYKNAITNELFLFNALKLALSPYLHAQLRAEGAPPPSNSTVDKQSALAWATKEFAWFNASGMIDRAGGTWLVNDGLDAATCKNNGGTTWTYNQGVLVGGLALMHTAFCGASSHAHEACQPSASWSDYLDLAQKVADAAIERLSYPDGTLKEVCEPDACNMDQAQFKGIFMRNLSLLARVLFRGAGARGRDLYRKYAAYVHANADRAWNKARTSEGTFGLVWNAAPSPSARVDAVTHTSALELLVAACALPPLPETEAHAQAAAHAQ